MLLYYPGEGIKVEWADGTSHSCVSPGTKMVTNIYVAPEELHVLEPVLYEHDRLGHKDQLAILNG